MECDPLAGQHAGHGPGDLGVLAREHDCWSVRTVTFEPKRAKTWANSIADRPRAQDDQALGNPRSATRASCCRATPPRRVRGSTGGPAASRSPRRTAGPRPASCRRARRCRRRRTRPSRGRRRCPGRAGRRPSRGRDRVDHPWTRPGPRGSRPGRPGVDAELAGPADLADQLRGLDEPLAGHAGAEAALAVRARPVRSGRPSPPPRAADWPRSTPGTATDHHEVIHRRDLETRPRTTGPARKAVAPSDHATEIMPTAAGPRPAMAWAIYPVQAPLTIGRTAGRRKRGLPAFASCGCRNRRFRGSCSTRFAQGSPVLGSMRPFRRIPSDELRTRLSAMEPVVIACGGCGVAIRIRHPEIACCRRCPRCGTVLPHRPAVPEISCCDEPDRDPREASGPAGSVASPDGCGPPS